MTHAFTFDKKYYLYDVESGALMACDRLTFLLVSREKDADAAEGLAAYSAADIAEAESELAALRGSGHMDGAPAELPQLKSDGAVKSLCLHICHDCNLACTYCFAGGGSYSGGRETMSAETGKKAVDFLIAHSGGRRNLEMDFFGGEPLMNLDAVKSVVAYARSLELKHGKLFKFTLTTNGLMLDEQTIAYLNAEMENVVVSIDGRKSVHDAVRPNRGGGGSYDTVLKKAKRFRALRGDKSHYIRGTFTAKNTDFTQDVLALSDEGFDQISLEPVVLEAGHPLAITKEHLPAVLAEYETLAKAALLRRKGDGWFNFFHFMIDLQHGTCMKKRLTGCGAGDEYLAVSPSGQLFPCHQFVGKPEYCLGNVEDGIQNPKIRALFQQSSLLTKPLCADCFAKYACSGGCAANNITHMGDIDTPFPDTCAMTRKRLECALAMYAEERGG